MVHSRQSPLTLSEKSLQHFCPQPIQTLSIQGNTSEYSVNQTIAWSTLQVVEMTQNFWRDRPVLVTGATGLVGSWLIRRLREAGADVVCLVRDWVPQCELVRSGLIEQVKVVRGDIRDRDCLERAIGEYEVDTVIHLAAQTIVGIANRNPISTFESNIQGTWDLLEACRRRPSVKQIVVASSDKAYGDQENCPTAKTRRCKAGIPTTSASRAPT